MGMQASVAWDDNASRNSARLLLERRGISFTTGPRSRATDFNSLDLSKPIEVVIVSGGGYAGVIDAHVNVARSAQEEN